ncbi:MAG: alanine--tRNA ligase, partial [Bacteroidetes bacterium]|nr:alanine--tRNA ligase [Bacteroidota bacterium]
MTVSQIRQQFFDFFESKGHVIVSSAPMVVKNDPTLMFTNAGMNQFKDYFLGYQVPRNRRVANSQKCLRVSGKHNDLEEVGVDTYHHTMFEMLGNWSFGDYFKEDAIAWAWELLTEIYKIPVDRLYITVFEGDAKDNVPRDEESYNIWKKFISEDRIILASKKDNFWEMGDTGPCGPCTEIHVDLRDESERLKINGRDLVNRDHPQLIEIWNNVFMQFNRKADGSLEALPETHVDTGMGLERLAMALQGKQSNYDSDLFQTLIQHMVKVSGIRYGKSEETDIALRVIADHVRTISFSIADGQLPANNGAGYVIRRILRRAVRYGYQSLGLKESFLSDLSLVLVELMGNPYEELIREKELIAKVIREEENSFFRTLEQGIKRMDDLIQFSKGKNQSIISGEAVFELYDTYGFPVDLTSLIARENGMNVDEEGFQRELQIQKDRSRAATAVEADDWIQINTDVTTQFIGYDCDSSEVQIIKYRKVSQKQKIFYQLVLDQTPFYPEGGGQVGDKGILRNESDTIFIFDTKKENNLIIHLTDKIPAHMSGSFSAQIDSERRDKTSLNHSATHLLHHALRTVLGTHVEQKGSLVNSDYLRFDFAHFAKVRDEEMEQIEALITEAIHQNISLDERRAVPIDEAKAMGAMALFGEKYGDSVRVIKFGDSVELCGGIHVSNTAKIGLFKITSESAVAAGVRRIEAITGATAEAFFKEKATKLDTISALLKNPKDLVKSIDDLIQHNSQLIKEIEHFQRQKAKGVKAELLSKITEINGIHFLSEIIALDANSVKDILFQLKDEVRNFVGIIGNTDEGKCGLSLIISNNLVESNKWNAAQLIREVSSHIQGGGGGQ